MVIGKGDFEFVLKYGLLRHVRRGIAVMTTCKIGIRDLISSAAIRAASAASNERLDCLSI